MAPTLQDHCSSADRAMSDKVIEFLLSNPGRFFSGEEISKSLGISRQALWKKISSLRKNGWNVEGKAGKGYRLASIPSHVELETLRATFSEKNFWEEIHILESVDSTNSFLLKRYEGGIKRAIAIGDEQSSGRGRMGRRWFSPRGKNINMSVLLPLAVSPALSPAITIVAGLSVAGAIRDKFKIPCQVKWPNDVYLAGKKLCGILTEMVAELDSTRSVVIGIGINVNSERRDFPPHLRDLVISLKEYTGKDIMRVDVASSVVELLLRNLEIFQRRGLEMFIEKWNRLSFLKGKVVTLRTGKEKVQGEVKGIHRERGYLVLEDEGGNRFEIISGDVEEIRDR